MGEQDVKASLNAAATSFEAVPGFKAIQLTLTAIVDAIVQEIIDRMNETVASEGKSFTAGALVEWKPKLENAVYIRLSQGGDWATDKVNVLAVAEDMARIACMISGPLPDVSKVRVHAAFRAVKDHQVCPVPPGGGRWCDFDI